MPTRKDVFPTAQDINITSQSVEKLLHALNPHKAAGPDDIKPRILKELSSEIDHILTTICRKSYKTGIIPDVWSKANVTPVYKKGQKYVAANYRPISLTFVCCKIMEHIITSHITKHTEEHNIPYPLQHGFRKGRSCETQLLEFVDDITTNMSQGKQTDVLVMDCSKAFDIVSHALLIHKLDYYGIRGKTNRWNQAFLHNRSQTVEGERYDIAKVESGFPKDQSLNLAYSCST